MALPINIKDTATGYQARVSQYGELIIGKVDYSAPYYAQIAIAATPTKILDGVAGKKFVVTDVLIAANKNFATATVSETVTIYEANPADLATNTKTFFKVDLLRNGRLVATGLNIITDTTRSLVGITPTSTEVDITIAGYYVPV